MQMISVKQLRTDFRSVKTAIGQGKSLLLIYRSQPLAEIKPVTSTAVPSAISDNDRIKADVEKIRKLAGGFRSGKGYTPDEMNRLYDQQYEPLLH